MEQSNKLKFDQLNKFLESMGADKIKWRFYENR